MFRLPALFVVARILILIIRIKELNKRLRARGRPSELDDIDLLHELIAMENVLGEARPLLEVAEFYGVIPPRTA